MRHHIKHTVVPTLTLFTSMSTLVCCALPALFVLIGAGASLAGLVGNFPQLVWISQHKPFIFGFSAIMLSLGGLLRWHSRNEPCPSDPAKGRACGRMKRVSGIIYWSSVIMFLTGS